MSVKCKTLMTEAHRSFLQLLLGEFISSHLKDKTLTILI